jgi:hypothetical protein
MKLRLEKRKYERDNCTDIVHYAPYPHSSDTVMKGLIQDFSCSGLCPITHHALEEGQEIVLKSIFMPNAKTVVVRRYQYPLFTCKCALQKARSGYQFAIVIVNAKFF